MKHSLEDKIKNNLSFFEEEPPTGHQERFERLLLKKKKKPYRRYLLSISSVAAILIIGFTLFPDRKVNTAICSDPVCEVKQFYQMQLLDETEELEDILQTNRELKREIELLLDDSRVEKLNNMTESDKIAFIINYYNRKIESVKHIKELLL